MRRPLLLLLSTLLVAAACDDAGRSTGPVMGNVPRYAISDGANSSGGVANGDFFFLPPMVRNPSASPAFDVGAFDATRQPRVDICRLTTTAPQVCDLEVRSFSGSSITVSTTDEQYQVNWRTDLDDLAVDRLYRITVGVPRVVHGHTEYFTLGYADVQPVSNGSGLKKVDTDEYIGLVDGRTLPIKFRIEKSPRCESSEDCVEAIVSDEGGRVETESGYAVAIFPEGWLPAGFDEVIVAVRRVPIGTTTGQESSCHGSPNRQYEGCYDFATFPAVGEFALPVTVATCIEPDAFPVQDYLQLYASDDGEDLRALPPAEVLIECDGFDGTPPPVPPIGFMDRVGHELLALGTRLGTALSPREAHAIDLGRGGLIDRFSHVGWILVAETENPDVEASTIFGAAGTAHEVSVRVRSAHTSQAARVPLAGFPVTFSVAAGGGTVSLTTVPTNADGIATTTWTFGTEGPQELQATAAGANGTVTLAGEIVTQVATTTILAAGTIANAGSEAVILAAVAGGVPQPGETPTISFFDGATLLGTAPVNGDGQASFLINGWSVRPHVLTARFDGTPTLAPSTSAPATVHVVRFVMSANEFVGSLDGETMQTQDFSGFDIGTPISSIIPGVLDVSSTFEQLEVFGEGRQVLFGYDEVTRVEGNGHYFLDFEVPRTAIGFNITGKDPATPHMAVAISTAVGSVSYGLQNFLTENDPIWVGLVSSLPITRVIVVEGTEVNGSGNEETSLDDFFVGFVTPEP